MSAASDTATCEKVADSFLAYCRRNNAGLHVEKSDFGLQVDADTYIRVVAWAVWWAEAVRVAGTAVEPLPIVLSVDSCKCLANVRSITAALDGSIRDAQGAVIATVTMLYCGKPLAAADIRSWVATSCRLHLLCLVTPNAAGTSCEHSCTLEAGAPCPLTHQDAAVTVPDLESELERCLRAAPAGTRLGRSWAFASPYDARHAQLYACTEEQLDTAERALLRRGYVLPSWRSDVAYGPDASQGDDTLSWRGQVSCGETLHKFIRQPLTRATLSYGRDESGELYTEVVSYLGLVMALL